MTGRTYVYERLECALRTHSGDAVLVAIGDVAQREVWLPRACLHPEDAAGVDGYASGAKLQLRVLKWKADKLGLTAQRDSAGAQRDLFGG